MPAPPPEEEDARAAALREYRVLDTEPEDAYDDVTRLAAQLCGTPIALISLIDRDRHWFKSVQGLDIREIPLRDAFCAHTVLQAHMLIVPDAALDPRFRDNPYVTGEPGIRFYAGVPLVTEAGHILGALCILDRAPRTLTGAQQDALRVLARQVTTQLELRRQVQTLARLSDERARAERRQRSSEDSLRQLGAAAASATEGIIIADARRPELPITYANPAFLALTGYAEHEVLGHNCRFMQGPGTDADSKRRIREAIALGVSCRVTLLNYRKDGSTFWNELTVAPVRDEAGALTHFVGIQHDITALKETEAALRRGEAKFRSIIDVSPVPFCLNDERQNVTLLNAKFVRTFGYTLADIPTLADWWRRAYPDPEYRRRVRTAWRARLEQAARQGATFEPMEVDVCCKDGTTRTVVAEAAALEPSFRGQHLVILHDITEQRRQEAALRRNQARLVEAQRIGGIGDWELDVAARRFAWSDEVFRLMEFDPAQGVPEYDAVMGRYHPDDLAARDSLFARSLETGEPYQCDLRLRLPSGTPRWCHLVGQPVTGAGGRVVRVVGTAQDVTERVLSEQELSRLADYNRLLLESTAEGIYGLDRDGRCTFINAAAARLLGHAAPDVIGREMHPLVHHSRSDGSPYPVDDCPLRQALQRGESCHIETELLWRADGTPFNAAYSSFPLRSGGNVIGAVVTFSDITERVRAEQRLRDANAVLAIHQAKLEAANAELEALAATDPLTGLLNYRSFQQRLERAGGEAAREGTPYAVAVVDLDGFRFFNDVYGTAAGDSVLRRVAERLRAAGGADAAVAHFGGDEFTLLLPAAGTTHAGLEARLRAALAGLSYQPAGAVTAIPITASVGVALSPQDAADRNGVVQRAEERLRRAKTGGAGEVDELRAALAGSVEGFSMLDALVTAVDNKDRYTRRHSEDVLEHSLLIAREIGLAEPERRTLAVAALLHDVGKIGVPDHVLRKPGALTGEEMGAVRQHPMMGAIIVGAVPGLEGTLDAVRHHHERWDGGGYPFGLRGAETPLAARVLAVADAFSAMTTDRPYRKGMGPGEASALLSGGAGTQWDPDCVRALLRARQGAGG